MTQPATPFGRHSFTRGAAIFTAALFLSMELFRYAPSAYAQPAPFKVQGGYPAKDLSRLVREVKVRVPPELGFIDESFQGPSGRTVIYIQDAHDSLEAQQNIAKLIQHLAAQYGVKTVFEEGYEGVVPTEEYFGAIQDLKVRERVAYFLMDHLRIGGAEYAHIMSGTETGVRSPEGLPGTSYPVLRTSFTLTGADSLKLHRENISQYRRSAERKKEIASDLAVLEKNIRALSDHLFPKALKTWMRGHEQWETGRLPLPDYLERTLKLLPFQPEDSRDYPSIRLFLTAGKTGRKELVQKVKDIRAKELFSEMEEMEHDLAKRFLKSETARRIFDHSLALDRLRRLNDLRLSFPEYEAAKESLRNLDTQKIGEFIGREVKKPLILSRRWEKNIREAIRFYDIAEARNRVIEKSLLQDHRPETPEDPGMRGHIVGVHPRVRPLVNEQIRDLGPTRGSAPTGASVLVYGGFHKDSIRAMLRKQGISYYVVTPKITSEDLEHQDYYKKLMTAGRLPFELPLALRTAARAETVFEIGKTHPALVHSEIRTLMSVAESMKNASYADFSLAAEKALRSEVREKISEELKVKSEKSKPLPSYSERSMSFERKSSGVGLRVSRLLMDAERTSKRRGGIRTRMIPGWGGGSALSAKSLSWVMRILFSVIASARTLPFVMPLGGSRTSWPIFFKMGISPWWTFSSSRKFISLKKSGIKFPFLEHPGGVMERSLDVDRGQPRISGMDFPDRGPLFKHLEHKMNHDASPSEYRFSVTDIWMNLYVFPNKIFHKILRWFEVYHGMIGLSREVSLIFHSSLLTFNSLVRSEVRGNGAGRLQTKEPPISLGAVQNSRFVREGLVKIHGDGALHLVPLHFNISRLQSDGELVEMIRRELGDNKFDGKRIYLTLNIQRGNETLYLAAIDSADWLRDDAHLFALLKGKTPGRDSFSALNNFDFLMRLSEYPDGFHLRHISIGNNLRQVPEQRMSEANLLQRKGYGSEMFKQMALFIKRRWKKTGIPDLRISAVDGTGKNSWTFKRMQDEFGYFSVYSVDRERNVDDFYAIAGRENSAADIAPEDTVLLAELHSRIRPIYFEDREYTLAVGPFIRDLDHVVTQKDKETLAMEEAYQGLSARLVMEIKDGAKAGQVRDLKYAIMEERFEQDNPEKLSPAQYVEMIRILQRNLKSEFSQGLHSRSEVRGAASSRKAQIAGRLISLMVDQSLPLSEFSFPDQSGDESEKQHIDIGESLALAEWAMARRGLIPRVGELINVFFYGPMAVGQAEPEQLQILVPLYIQMFKNVRGEETEDLARLREKMEDVEKFVQSLKERPESHKALLLPAIQKAVYVLYSNIAQMSAVNADLLKKHGIPFSLDPEMPKQFLQKLEAHYKDRMPRAYWTRRPDGTRQLHIKAKSMTSTDKMAYAYAESIETIRNQVLPFLRKNRIPESDSSVRWYLALRAIREKKDPLVYLRRYEEFLQLYVRVLTQDEKVKLKDVQGKKVVDPEHLLRFFEPKIIAVFELMGEDGFALLSSFIGRNPQALHRFLDQFAVFSSDATSMSADYYGRQGKKKMPAVTKLMELISAFVEINKPAFLRAFKRQQHLAPEEMIKQLSGEFFRTFLKKMGIHAAGIKPEALQRLPSQYLSRLSMAVRFLERHSPRHIEILKQLIQAALAGKQREWIHGPEDGRTPSAVAQHNQQVRERMRALSVDSAKWLDYGRTATIRSTGGELKISLDSKVDYILQHLTNAIKQLRVVGRNDLIEVFQNAFSRQRIKIQWGGDPQGEVRFTAREGTLQGILQQPHVLEQLEKTIRFVRKQMTGDSVSETLFHVSQAMEDIQEVFSHAEIIRELQKKPRTFTLRPWARDPLHDLFLGDFTGCCFASNSNEHFHSMIDHVLDEGIQVVEVIDEEIGQTVALAWLFLAEDEKGKAYLVMDNIEVRGGYSEIESLKNKIKTSLLDYAVKYAEDLGLDTVLGSSFGYSEVSMKEFPSGKVEGLKKVGGYFGEKPYFIEALLGDKKEKEVLILHDPRHHVEVIPPKTKTLPDTASQNQPADSDPEPNSPPDADNAPAYLRTTEWFNYILVRVILDMHEKKKAEAEQAFREKAQPSADGEKPEERLTVEHESSAGEQVSAHPHTRTPVNPNTRSEVRMPHEVRMEKVNREALAAERAERVARDIVPELEQIEAVHQEWEPSIFVAGSARIPPVHPYYKLGVEVGKEIHKSGEAGKTGAAFGIMEAVPAGILESRKAANGIHNGKSTQGAQIVLPQYETTLNPYMERVRVFKRFLTRIMALDENSKGMIVMPGGYGSLQELFEGQRRGRRIVLIPTEFWKPIMEAFDKSWREYGFPVHFERKKRVRLKFLDSPAEAVAYAKAGVPHRISPEDFARMKKELIKGLKWTYNMDRSIVVLGKLYEERQETQFLKGLIRKIGQRFDVPIRATSHRMVFKTAYEVAKQDGWLDRLYVAYHMPDEASALTAEEKSLGDRIIGISNPSIHQIVSTSNASAYIFLPGGIGTMNRLFEILTLIQTGQIARRPVFLVGHGFWDPIFKAIFHVMLEREPGMQMISEDDRNLVQVIGEGDDEDVLKKIGESVRSFDQTDEKLGQPSGEGSVRPIPGMRSEVREKISEELKVKSEKSKLLSSFIFHSSPFTLNSFLRSEMRKKHRVALAPVASASRDQILNLQQDVIAIIEQVKIDALSPERYKELLALAGLNKTKLHLVIPDALASPYSRRVAELQKIASVNDDCSKLLQSQSAPVIGFSDAERDTLQAFRKRLDPALVERMKAAAFILDEPGAFGVGLLYALKNISSDQLAVHSSGFLYDAAGRWAAQVLEALQDYAVISVSA